MPERPKKTLALGRPKDKSLEAYREWIISTVMALTGKSRGEVSDLSDEEWRARWKAFWGED